MCMTVFVAAAEPLPFIPWDPARPAFHLQRLAESEQFVRLRFTQPHIYFLGAHTGCSCGFNYGLRDVQDSEDQAEEHASRASVDALRGYLANAVERLGAVEVLACWERDWALEPQRARVTPEWFGGDTFAMPEGMLFSVTAA